jgi:hypothetical protein
MPMLAITSRFHAVLLAAAATLMIGSGCCGPRACGPVGCGGPIMLGGPSCGGCDNGCNGCGERYYDEWINHPPSCCDPCDSCGNHGGQSDLGCRPIMRGFASIWGYRCDAPPTCDRGGCDSGCGSGSCGGGCTSGCSSCGGGEVLHQHPIMTAGPTPLSAKPRKSPHSQVAHVDPATPKPKPRKPAGHGNNGIR